MITVHWWAPLLLGIIVGIIVNIQRSVMDRKKRLPYSWCCPFEDGFTAKATSSSVVEQVKQAHLQGHIDKHTECPEPYCATRGKDCGKCLLDPCPVQRSMNRFLKGR